jgi:glutamate synthase domain-containing protein 3
VLNPNGAHAIAVGVTEPVQIEIKGHVGYYCAGMNAAATVVVDGHAGAGLAENIMSGLVGVRGNASQSAAASGRGGLVVIEGDASARCGTGRACPAARIEAPARRGRGGGLSAEDWRRGRVFRIASGRAGGG